MQQKNEIALLDILVVIIKHRRLIVGLTTLSVLFTGIIFFTLPFFGIISFGTFTVKASVLPSQLPPALVSELGVDPYVLISNYAQAIESVSEAVVRNGLVKEFSNDTNGWKLNTYIAREFLNQIYKVRRESSSIIFEVKVENVEAGKTFISDIISHAEKLTRSNIAERSVIIAESMESLYKEASDSTVLSDTAKQLIIASRKYAEDRVPALISINKPEVLIDSQRRAKSSAIIVLATLFISIFLAFILEYIEYIKNDFDSSQKIRQALEK